MDRFERQSKLFGAEGQERLRTARVGIVGGGGIGSFVLLELAYLGIGEIVLVDNDLLEISNRNRLVGAWESHPEGKYKVQILKDLVKCIDSGIRVETIPDRIEDLKARNAVPEVDVVMGCLDNDGPRLSLNQLCCERGIPYIDAATDTVSEDGCVRFGGRVCVATKDTGCLMCFQVLDQNEIREYHDSDKQKSDRDDIYGVPKTALVGGGPSVITVNGVIASLAATELMVLLTGIRPSIAHSDWHGDKQQLLQNTDRKRDCYYCGLRPSKT